MVIRSVPATTVSQRFRMLQAALEEVTRTLWDTGPQRVLIYGNDDDDTTTKDASKDAAKKKLPPGGDGAAPAATPASKCEVNKADPASAALRQ